MDAELMAKLDEYLDGCPDPTGKPWWLVKRSSRLLWECRERLRALSPPASAAVVPIPKVQATAPERIWLAVADDKHYADEPFPDGVEEVCWSHDAPLEVCVPYVRADLATPTPPAAAQEDGIRVPREIFNHPGLVAHLTKAFDCCEEYAQEYIWEPIIRAMLTSPDSGKEGDRG